MNILKPHQWGGNYATMLLHQGHDRQARPRDLLTHEIRKCAVLIVKADIKEMHYVLRKIHILWYQL